MKNILIWIGLGFVVAGAVMGVIESALIAIVFISIGFTFEVATLVTKTKKKDWKIWSIIIGIATGSLLMGIAGFTGDTVKIIIIAVVGLVLILASILLSSLIKNRN